MKLGAIVAWGILVGIFVVPAVCVSLADRWRDEAEDQRRAACYDIGIDHGRFLQSVDIARARGETLPRSLSVKPPPDCAAKP